MLINQLNLIFSLVEQTCVYLVVAYLFSRTRLFIPLTRVTIRPTYKLVCYLVFSIFCIMGTFLGLHIGDSIANTRAIGAVLGGILGGPVVGVAVGLTGGLHRYTLGGMSAEACMISTICEGLIGGLVHVFFRRRGNNDQLLSPLCVGVTTLVAEFAQMFVILSMVRPFHEAVSLVANIALPMWIANTVGAAMFMRILLDRRALFETESGLYSSKALKIASRTEGVLRHGLNVSSSLKIAQILLEETGVGAVAITDRNNILAFVGVGDDHHKPNMPISSEQTRQAIDQDVIIYADGNEIPYHCSISDTCPLGISMAVPLHGENEQVVGAIKMYELRSRVFTTINRALGEGIGHLLSSQILVAQYQEQKELLAQTEIKLLHAQVNPHFLFNTLNTLSAVIRQNPDRARLLVQNLSTFFRKNLKRPAEIVSLGDELEHVTAYLQIELARFPDKLSVHMDVPDEMKGVALPAFSLQPLVENAIKHGTSQLLGQGEVKIKARLAGNVLSVIVEDNAGLFQQPLLKDGLGMNLVDQRIKNHYGESFGLFVNCERDVSTRVELRVPFERLLSS